MKIVSKFKDYYDFLSGKYGIDFKVVYDRTSKVETGPQKYFSDGEWKPPHLECPERSDLWYVAVCGMMFTAYYTDRVWHFGAEAVRVMGEDLRKRGNNVPFHACDYNPYKFNQPMHLPDGIASEFEPTDANDRYGCPVLLCRNPRFPEGWVWRNVNLSTLKFARAIEPEKMWTLICNWLSREKEVVDTRTDTMKAQSKGFNDKSFKNTDHRISRKKPRRRVRG